MGTRALTVFQDSDNNEIAVLYRQFDGYEDGHGKELVEFLENKEILNGISGQTLQEAFNGMNCLAAAVVAHFKQEIGRIYLYPAGTRDCGEEYIYTISGKGGTIQK